MDEKCGNQYVYRQVGTRYDRDHIVNTNRSGRRSVPVWGWMDASGPGKLVKIIGKFTGAQYNRILENEFLPAIWARYGQNASFRFIHDRSPIHKSIIVRNWSRTHPEIEVLDWPPKGADLNVIENAWGALKARTGSMRNTTSDELFELAQRQWQIMSTHGDSLVSLMPERLNAVQGYEGGWTGY